MRSDYNEHESGDSDGMGCARGIMVAVGIDLAVVCIVGLIWFLSSS